MTTAQVLKLSVITNNSLSEDYSHSDDQTRQTTDTPEFKPFTMSSLFTAMFLCSNKKNLNMNSAQQQREHHH